MVTRLAVLLLLSCLARAADPPPADAEQQMIVELLGSSDRDMRGLALQQVREAAPGEPATRTFAGLLPGLAPENQAALLEALGDRGDRAAKRAVRSALASPELKVRLAALRALGRLGGPEDVPALADRAAQGSPAEQAAARQALTSLRGDNLGQAMAAALDTAGPKARAELLRILTARKAAEALPALRRDTAHPDLSVRLAAWAGLEVLAGPQDVPTLLPRLLSIPDEEERAAAEAALAAVCGRSGESSVDALLEPWPKADASGRQALLRLLAVTGSLKALAIVNTSLTHQDTAVREQAWRVLSNWPNSAAAPPLVQAARDTTNALHKTLALRGIVRLAGAEEPANSRLLAAAWTLAGRAEDQRLVLGALGGADTPEALSLAAQAMDNPALAPEATLATMMIAERLPPGSVAQAREALRKAVRTAKEAPLRERAERRLKALDATQP